MGKRERKKTVEPRIEAIKPVKTKAEELEAILYERLFDRYRDANDVPEDIVHFFERQVEAEEHGIFPPLLGAGKRKQRTVANDGGATAPDGVSDGSTASDPPTTNRGVTIHETENTCPRIMGGYDGGVTMGLTGFWEPRAFEAVKTTLTAAKESANNDDFEGSVVDLAGKAFKVNGKASGGGVNYAFVIHGDGMTLLIHGNPNPGKQIQPIRLTYAAEGLIGRDLFLKHYETLTWLESLGFTTMSEKLSRVDMQVMVYRDMDEFVDAVWENRTVCTAYNYDLHGKGLGKRISTITLGSKLQICIYDKREELLAGMRKHPEKLLLMVQNCFGEQWLESEIPTTRVEFRVHRKILKSMKIDTMKDLLEHEAGLVRYCNNSWFRVLAEPKKKGHSHEQEVSALWKEVQTAFETYFPGVAGHRKEVQRRKPEKSAVNVEGDTAQARGCLAKGIAYLFGKVETFDDAMDKVAILLKSQGEKFLKRISDCATEIAIKLDSARETVRLPLTGEFWADFGPIVDYDAYGDEIHLSPVPVTRTVPARPVQHYLTDNYGRACHE